MEVVFSHRPLTGVSVGAYSKDGRLYFATALVNDGTSRNGIYHDDRRDTFSRMTARSIIRGRISRMLNSDEPVGACTVFETELSARQFMKAFREVFKPTNDESDDVLIETEPDFQYVGKTGSVGHAIDVRYRPTANEIFNRVMTMANEVIADASTCV